MVTVLNEVVSFSQDEIERFTHFLFRRDSTISSIVFCAIEVQLRDFSLPFQRLNYLEDITIKLPSSVDQFVSGLGSSVRRNLKRYERLIVADYPSFAFHFFSDDEIQAQDIHDIVVLNQARMSEKNKVSAIDEAVEQNLLLQSRRQGLVCVATIDGKICAGAICFRTGKNYFMTVIAHDSQYGAYRLGNLCCKKVISRCIENGGNEFHFLWGRYEYKYMLSGVQRDLFRVVIYRSRLQQLLQLRLALRVWISAQTRALRLYLLDAKKSDGVFPQIAHRCLTAARRLRNR